MYPGMGKTKIRLAKIKKRDEEIASQVFLGNKGRKLFKKTQQKNPSKVRQQTIEKELRRDEKSRILKNEKNKEI